MLKTFKYRLYPTKRQERQLSKQLEELRWLWNTLLAERKQAWEERHEAISYYDQQTALPGIKAALRPALAQVHALVAQDVVRRLQKAMDAFFRRLKEGEKPGYPRFRSKGRYDSLTYPQWQNGGKLSASGKRLPLSKIGDVKLLSHRPLEGTPKTATIRCTAPGKWFVTISCEWEPTPLPPTGKAVGIDVGLKTFATLTAGPPTSHRESPLLSSGRAGAFQSTAQASTGPGHSQGYSRSRHRTGQSRAAGPRQRRTSTTPG